MAAHAHMRNEFTVDEKCHNLMSWLISEAENNKGDAQENTASINEPTYEIMALFVLHKLNLQTHMRSYPVGLDVWFLVGPFVCFHT